MVVEYVLNKYYWNNNAKIRMTIGRNLNLYSHTG